MKKIYLGDSVYAVVDSRGSIVLTTENGEPDDPSNIIILEPEVVKAFLKFIEDINEES